MSRARTKAKTKLLYHPLSYSSKKKLIFIGFDSFLLFSLSIIAKKRYFILCYDYQLYREPIEITTTSKFIKLLKNSYFSAGEGSYWPKSFVATISKETFLSLLWEKTLSRSYIVLFILKTVFKSIWNTFWLEMVLLSSFPYGNVNRNIHLLGYAKKLFRTNLFSPFGNEFSF